MEFWICLDCFSTLWFGLQFIALFRNIFWTRFSVDFIWAKRDKANSTWELFWFDLKMLGFRKVDNCLRSRCILRFTPDTFYTNWVFTMISLNYGMDIRKRTEALISARNYFLFCKFPIGFTNFRNFISKNSNERRFDRGLLTAYCFWRFPQLYILQSEFLFAIISA